MLDSAVDISLSLMVEMALEENKTCEHREHYEPKYSWCHAGKAEWYVQGMCNDCGYISAVTAVCDKWIQAMAASDMLAICFGCKEYAEMVFLVKEKINPGRKM